MPEHPPTVSQILSDESLRRRLFPVTGSQIFLAHAGVAPLSGPAAEAVARESERAAREGQESADMMKNVAALRRIGAQAIGAKPEEIALLGPTALGLGLVSLGLDWHPEDEVVFYADDYPANVYPWRVLQERGVRPVALRPEVPGVITWELVRGALTSRTRLVALASCHYLTGYRLDYAAIGSELRQRGVPFCLDAIQTLGAFPLDVAGCVDFLAADSHKWMLGPNGAGLFYVRSEWQDRLRPALAGAWNVRSPHFLAQEAVEWENTARRYEPGSLNHLGNAGMAASLEILLGAGIPEIAQRLLHLRRTGEEMMAKRGIDVLHARRSDAEVSGIISLRLGHRDPKEVFNRLHAAGIAASIRIARSGEPLLRLSPHFYNQESDLEAAAEVIG